MHKFNIFTLLLLAANQCQSAKPPSDIIDQMTILSKIEATISVCFDSTDYKKIKPDEALKFYDINAKIYEISEAIDKKYNDNMAYIVIKMSAMDVLESREFLRFFDQTYSRKCAPQIIVDMNKVLEETRNKVNQIMRKK